MSFRAWDSRWWMSNSPRPKKVECYFRYNPFFFFGKIQEWYNCFVFKLLDFNIFFHIFPYLRSVLENGKISINRKFNRTTKLNKKSAFLRRYSVPLLISGIVWHHYFYIRGTRVEVKGIRHNNSTYFYFIYKGFVEVASDLISLKKASWCI